MLLAGTRGAPAKRAERKERESNPQAREGHAVFETGYHANGSPSMMAPAGIEPALTRSRVGGSAGLSYGAVDQVWPAGFEPAAPRVSGGRSTGLSYGHASESASPSVHLPAREIDAAATRPRSMSRTPAGLRCFPCLSPTLRPWIVGHRLRERGWLPSFVEGLWSPSLVSKRRNGSVKQRRMPQRLFQRKRRASFSLRRGLDSSCAFLQLSITSRCRDLVASETTKATRWVALTVGCYAASFLAHEPLSEDGCIIARAFRRAGRLRIPPDDRGMGWRDDEKLDVCRDHCLACSIENHRASIGILQANLCKDP